MYTLDKRIMVLGSGNYVGFEVKDEFGNIRCICKDDILLLAEKGLLTDVELFYDNKLRGINGFRVSAIKNKYVDSIEFDTLDSLMEGGVTEMVKRKPEKPKQNVEIKAIKIDRKFGHVSLITKVSNEEYEKVFYLVSVKHTKCDEAGNICFSTYLRNWLCRVMTLDFDKYSFTISKEVFKTLVHNKKVSKNFKVVGVDVFNIVHPNIHADLCEMYNFIVKYAKVV